MSTTAVAAAKYHRRGLKPVPNNRKTKKSIGKAWQNTPYEPQQFNGNVQNVGLQLGAAGGSLVDIDLDTEAAIGLAPEFLPPTDSIFGHNSKPCSHQLYLSDLCDTEKKAVLAFREHVDGKQPCDKCGDDFTPRHGSGGSKQRFCSDECRMAFHKERQRAQRSSLARLVTGEERDPRKPTITALGPCETGLLDVAKTAPNSSSR
jgi:predicted nucleic acid-binding Zn ribbon protein